MATKKLKDPIYGYVEIDAHLFESVIDTFEFQRLRSIRQTSYSPLYSSALHNRFIHSIGVYHLGKIAFSSLEASVKEKFPGILSNSKMERTKNIFELACLLHDVGHSPFSHSGENFYLEVSSDSEQEIYSDLGKAVGNEQFSNDMKIYHTKEKHAAPHEIMSATIALEAFPHLFLSDDEKSFFARCITGYQYLENQDFEYSFYNIVISLLNSTIIDVDKLDYLIRDAFVTGYDSISIDFIRLLNSITIHVNDSKCVLAYHKSALRVIENVVYAHDSERKWIQNHPVVLYEHFLIQNAIKSVTKSLSNDRSEKLFCKRALTKEGVTFSNGQRICLLSDNDIIFLSKNVCPNSLTDEYFQRKSRRHPIWKSEAEYKTMFMTQLGEDKIDKLEEEFKKLEKFLNEELGTSVIDGKAIEICNKIIDEINGSSEINLVDQKLQLKKYNNFLQIINYLKEFAVKNEIPFDFAIVGTKHFNSGFQKQELSNTIITFPNLDTYNKLEKVVNILSSDKQREYFFFLYYKKMENKKLNVTDLSREMCKLCFDLD